MWPSVSLAGSRKSETARRTLRPGQKAGQEEAARLHGDSAHMGSSVLQCFLTGLCHTRLSSRALMASAGHCPFILLSGSVLKALSLTPS